MRCAIRHDGCWATNLGSSPAVYDLKFWSGVKLDRTRVMGTFVVKTHEPLDVVSFNRYPLEFVDVFEEKVSLNEFIYTVEYVVEDRLKNTTINLLFESGCVFCSKTKFFVFWLFLCSRSASGGPRLNLPSSMRLRCVVFPFRILSSW